MPNIGDKVKCIDDKNSVFLEEGEIYIIKYQDEHTYELEGKPERFFRGRFDNDDKS